MKLTHFKVVFFSTYSVTKAHLLTTDAWMVVFLVFKTEWPDLSDVAAGANALYYSCYCWKSLL